MIRVAPARHKRFGSVLANAFAVLPLVLGRNTVTATRAGESVSLNARGLQTHPGAESHSGHGLKVRKQIC